MPAVRDASVDAAERRGNEFARLTDALVRRRVDLEAPLEQLRRDVTADYEQIVRDSIEPALEDAAEVLSVRLEHLAPRTGVVLERKPYAGPTLDSLRIRAGVVEGAFAADVARQGHGIQRAYLFAVLQQLAALRREQAEPGDSPLLLLVIEESELYQHPVRARYLARVLDELAASGTEEATQVMYTTHSPLFGSLEWVERLRLFRTDRTFPETSRRPAHRRST